MSRIAPLEDPFADLNPEQRAAVDHQSGPLLVIAGAGSGKTKTLSARVARLVRDGADPRRLLLLTFSRRAAGEMTKRAGAMLAAARPGLSAVELPWAGTFHAIGARLLRELAPLTGLSPDFTIHDRGDSADLIGMKRHELGFDRLGKRFPQKTTCLSIYSRAVNAEESLHEALALYPWCREWERELKQLFAAYVEAKQAQNVLDYDDLLAYWADLMDAPGIAQEVAGRFDHVLVDEYQDTNRLQARILAGLKPSGAGVTVVGDDAQSIYAFRAATVRNILDFPQQFSPPARIVTLEQNYRSTAAILQASNAVIALASERYAKALRTTRAGGAKPRLVTVRDEAEQARYVCERILETRERGIGLIKQAVLFRAADASAQLELELQRRDIPFVKFGGLKFLESAHVKDLIAILRFLQNPDDRIAGFRTLQLVPGIGPAKAARVLDGAPLLGPRQRIAAAPAPDGAEAIWRELSDLIATDTPWPAEIDRAARWYLPLLAEAYDDATARAADIHQLEMIAGGFPSRNAFLTELALDPPSATSAEAGPPLKDDDYLILSTIHSAKGQEWKAVYLLNAVDGCIPSDLATGAAAEIEEERRLLYVAMTRAKDTLDIITPQRFYVQGQARHGDKSVFAMRTRFIPRELEGLFEETVWPPAVVDEAGAGAVAAVIAPVDLAAKARGRWG